MRLGFRLSYKVMLAGIGRGGSINSESYILDQPVRTMKQNREAKDNGCKEPNLQNFQVFIDATKIAHTQLEVSKD